MMWREEPREVPGRYDYREVRFERLGDARAAMNQPEGPLASLGKPTNPISRVQPIEPDAALGGLEVEEGHEAIPWRGQTVEQVSKDFVLAQVDPQQQGAQERLRKRNSSGR